MCQEKRTTVELVTILFTVFRIHAMSIDQLRSMDIRAKRKLNGQPSRARIACLHCRARKVRCTLTIKGPPCTNCHLDGLECVTRPKLRRGLRESIDISLAEDVLTSSTPGPEKATPCYDLYTTEEVQDDGHRVCDLNGMEILGWQKKWSGGHATRLFQASLSVDSCMLPKDPSKSSRRKGLHEENRAVSNIPLDHNYPAPNRDVFFSHYPYLRAPKFRDLQPADQAFLKSQKSLHVPERLILGTIMSRYFLYVHSCLPIINEAEFWPMLHQEVTGKSFSLLVFQAMMFAACSVCAQTALNF